MIKLKDKVTIKTYGKEIGTGIVKAIVGNSLNSKSCYLVESEKGELLFYVKPELGTRKHLSVTNNTLWIEDLD